MATFFGQWGVLQMRMSKLLNCKPLRSTVVIWCLFLILLRPYIVLHQSLGYCFLNWMVEIILWKYCLKSKRAKKVLK